MDITKILLKNVGSAKKCTGNLYYDRSYPGLIESAGKLKAGTGRENEIITVSHGIAGWNRGYGTAPNAAELIKNMGSPLFESFISKISEIENMHKRWEPNEIKLKIDEAVSCAQQMLNVKSNTSVTVASKLLHFFSPFYFPPLDANVLNALGVSKIVENTFSEYMFSLLELGVADSDPKDNGLSIYWSWNLVISPVRAIDCTLYVAGKR